MNEILIPDRPRKIQFIKYRKWNKLLYKVLKQGDSVRYSIPKQDEEWKIISLNADIREVVLTIISISLLLAGVFLQIHIGNPIASPGFLLILGIFLYSISKIWS